MNVPLALKVETCSVDVGSTDFILSVRYERHKARNPDRLCVQHLTQ
jgi:hypothetical protein